MPEDIEDFYNMGETLEYRKGLYYRRLPEYRIMPEYRTFLIGKFSNRENSYIRKHENLEYSVWEFFGGGVCASQNFFSIFL